MLMRSLRHVFFSDRAVGRAFPATALERITAAIAASERRHSGELRFVVEAALAPLQAWRGLSARERAIELFSELRIWDTEHNNGVLIYLLLAEQNVEILADRGAASRIPPACWEEVCKAMETAFREGRFEPGVLEGLQRISSLLEEHFPAQAGNPNELPDRPLLL